MSLNADDDLRARLIQRIAWSTVAAWRIASVRPAGRLLCDWILILALFLLVESFGVKTRVRNQLLIGTMALLLGIYARGQVPHALTVIGLMP
jgi:hypothetical protein